MRKTERRYLFKLVDLFLALREVKGKCLLIEG